MPTNNSGDGFAHFGYVEFLGSLSRKQVRISIKEISEKYVQLLMNCQLCQVNESPSKKASLKVTTLNLNSGIAQNKSKSQKLNNSPELW